MKKETIFIIAIVVLILLNFLQISTRFISHQSPKDPIKRVVKHLSLDEAQEKKFYALAQGHRQNMIMLRKEQEILTLSYFENANDSLLQEISLIEKNKIKITKQHFNDVKSILNESQYDEFEEFKKQTLKKVLGFNPPRETRP